MANLKAIRDRIKSVKNTRKITEAMRLVAAEHLLLGAAHLGRSHEAHGLSDFAGVLDRLDSVSDFLEIRHVGFYLKPPKRPWWTRLR